MDSTAKRKGQATTTTQTPASGTSAPATRPVRAAAGAIETPDAKVKVLVEPAAGEFGPVFATIVGLLLLGVSTVVAMFVAREISVQVSKLPESYQTVAKDARVVPEYSETTGFIAFLVLAGLATVLLLVGAFLAAIETRGRLRRRVEPGSVVVTTDRAKVGASTANLPVDVEQVVDAAGGLIERLGSLRGTTAVIGAAVILYLCAVWVLLAT